MKELKLLSLFSGIGAFEKALGNIKVRYKLINYCEIDKYASKSYSVIHDVSEDMNLGDITKIDISKLAQDVDIITHGSPCTNYSVAGKGDGGDKGSGTASSLMWNTVEIVKYIKPKYVVWENVKNVLSKKHKHNFEQYINDLKGLGYTSYYQILNAKDFGIPQNRERIFCISILGEHTPYEFPIGFTLQYRLKDFLEKEVDEKYYLSKEIQDRFTKFPTDRLNNDDLEVIGTTAPNPYNKNGDLIFDKCTSAWCYNPNKCISTLSARDYKQPKQIIDKIIKEGNVSQYPKSQAGQVVSDKGLSTTLCSGTHGYAMGYIKENNVSNGAIRGRYDEQGNIEQKLEMRSIEQKLEMRSDECSNTITTVQKDNVIIEPKINQVGELDIKGYDLLKRVYGDNGLSPTLNAMTGGNRQPKILEDKPIKEGYFTYPNSNKAHQSNTCYNSKGLSPSLDTCQGGNRQTKIVESVDNDFKIRKLTPKECWRLMGFDDEDIEKCTEAKMSNTQLYKQAGNSICVSVLEAIFKKLLQKHIDN
ncbi:MULTISPECIES: DNA (cytosine-5-)-methyltransferase [unclassified Clostridioides]|uniref:DNA (cytosine-5-)-methyltransferase n=1 Tax=Clostridioides sp. ES-W-0018-02 TaxID=2770790 RepID=UPI001D114BB3|nr:DNA (cytosine-5-)-methyltransferase [Clostridioides sp. ES-W-0018-02]MCC0713002.1 DNA (cytosine-5-)-methyltransferase [Clostridioides sp. ES-W-0017-02]